MVNELIVEKGYAHAKAFEPDTKYKEILTEAQNKAAQNQEGLWNPKTCGGVTE